jgi:thiamine kinase-like enzyme
MVDRNGPLLAAFGRPLAAEVVRVLRDRGLPSHAIIQIQQLRKKHLVFRVLAAADSWNSSLIVKRLEPDIAQRVRLGLLRWLPWLGMKHAAPALLAVVAAPGGEGIWHLYEDVGGTTLHEHRSDRARVTAAVELIADLHTRAGGHPLLTECHRDGYDLGMHFFTSSVTDALRLLDALQPPAVSVTAEQAGVRDRLRRQLDSLLREAPLRARVMEDAGGPITLLHGDLWTTNILIGSSNSDARLIDWDRIGAGPFSYDLSTFLYRFPLEDRLWILDQYRRALVRADWPLASVADLNLLFETAECARYAYRISWPVIALLQEGAPWGFAELADIDGWFRALTPAIPA